MLRLFFLEKKKLRSGPPTVSRDMKDEQSPSLDGPTRGTRCATSGFSWNLPERTNVYKTVRESCGTGTPGEHRRRPAPLRHAVPATAAGRPWPCSLSPSRTAAGSPEGFAIVSSVELLSSSPHGRTSEWDIPFRFAFAEGPQNIF